MAGCVAQKISVDQNGAEATWHAEGRGLAWPASTPHRISLRLAARLLRLPLKGGVILRLA